MKFKKIGLIFIMIMGLIVLNGCMDTSMGKPFIKNNEETIKETVTQLLEPYAINLEFEVDMSKAKYKAGKYKFPYHYIEVPVKILNKPQYTTSIELKLTDFVNAENESFESLYDKESTHVVMNTNAQTILTRAFDKHYGDLSQRLKKIGLEEFTFVEMEDIENETSFVSITDEAKWFERYGQGYFANIDANIAKEICVEYFENNTGYKGTVHLEFKSEVTRAYNEEELKIIMEQVYLKADLPEALDYSIIIQYPKIDQGKEDEADCYKVDGQVIIENLKPAVR